MSAEKTLRELADAQDVTIGASMSADTFRRYPDDPAHADTLSREFNAVTTRSELKMGPLRPDRYTYDFEDADAIVNFGVENDMTVRGHTLIWHSQTPKWFYPWEYTDDQIRELLRDHIHTVAGRYREKVDVWDVVNEAISVDDDGIFRETVWYDAMGEEYLDLAFEWANEVAPGADLFLNDYGMDGINQKSDAMYDLVQRLLDRGAPIDGVGLQMHAFRALDAPDPESIGENIERFEDLGLDVHVTEMDVAYDRATVPDDHLEHQAQYYRDVLEACLENGCDTLITWGLNDANSWLREFDTSITDDPLLFDERFNPKPAYDAIVELLESRA